MRFFFKKTPPEMTEDDKTQYRHKKVRNIRKNPEALSDLPIELFLRLVGLFYAIPEEIRKNPEHASTAKEFETTRLFIDTQLANEDGDNFAKYEMADYVHNLHLTLVGVLPVDFLESHIHHLRDEYKSHVSVPVYKSYLGSKTHLFIDKYCCYAADDPVFLNVKARYENKLRHEYRNLVNEIRKAKLSELHIEDTRAFLMKGVFRNYVLIAVVPVFILLSYLFFIWSVDSSNRLHPGSYYPDIFNKYLGGVQAIVKPDVTWYNGFIGITLFSLSALFGAGGSLVSVLLRIQGVRDNSQLAHNIVAFKYSINSVKVAPFTGMVFAIILSLFFCGGLVSGDMFPKASDSWIGVLFSTKELAIWLIWCFIAGFSERLVPDMVDRIAAKAKKADEGS